MKGNAPRCRANPGDRRCSRPRAGARRRGCAAQPARPACTPDGTSGTPPVLSRRADPAGDRLPRRGRPRRAPFHDETNSDHRRGLQPGQRQRRRRRFQGTGEPWNL